MCFINMLGKSGLGMIIVFAVLVVIMLAVGILSLISKRNDKRVGKAASAATPLAPVASAATQTTCVTRAAGSCGGVVLNGVEQRTAAMLMAITADALKKPLCELRFVSIREINQ